jgi:hypothetical protein
LTIVRVSVRSVFAHADPLAGGGTRALPEFVAARGVDGIEITLIERILERGGAART